MMNFAMMSYDVVPGVMVGVTGPALAAMAAVAFGGVAYGFGVLARAALHRTDRPGQSARVLALRPAPHAA